MERVYPEKAFQTSLKNSTKAYTVGRCGLRHAPTWHGVGGNLGTDGNVPSASCGSHCATNIPNPCLFAIVETLRSFRYTPG
jgi:hypothetical protein